MLAAVSPTDIALFGILILVVVIVLASLCFWGIWLTRRKNSLSPYTRLPMIRGDTLSYFAKERVLRFLYYLHEYDNRIFEFDKCAICRETGRIFPDVITWYDKIKLDWSFLNKRYPGKYVSWGSLTTDQQEHIRNRHESLDGFQWKFSSSNPQPKAIEAKYTFAKPGPLYVDLDSGILLGWKCIPDTELEVLIVQKPLDVKYAI